jgi:hypothetical protein
MTEVTERLTALWFQMAENVDTAPAAGAGRFLKTKSLQGTTFGRITDPVEREKEDGLREESLLTKMTMIERG